MPRVLHVVHSLDPGGAERLVIEMIRGMRSRADFSVCCLDRSGEWVSEVQALGVPVWTIGRRPGFQPIVGKKIAEIAKADRMDVLHCHQYTPFVYGSLARLFHPQLSVVFTEHGRLADSRISWKRKMSNRILRRFPIRTVAVCEDLRRQMIEEGFSKPAIEVVYNGIRMGPSPEHGQREEARRLLNVHAGDAIIGTVARLDEVKDIPTLLRAHASLLERRPEAKLFIVGDGPERESLQYLSSSLATAPSVRFLGHREDVRDLLPGFDVYVNSSKYEGVSLAIVEAMAARLAVVATHIGGTPEVVVDGTTGLLVPPGDESALAAAIESLLRDRDRAQRFGAAGRERAEKLFDFDRMVEFYLRAYAKE